MRVWWSVLVGTLMGLVVLVAGAGSAAAEPPARLDERVTDRAGVLGSSVPEVEGAIERLRAEERLDLFVVFVESFDGAGGQEWADAAAERSQLGDDDAVLAVAVRDRAYGFSVTQDFPLSDSELDEILSDEVEPRLAAADWAGAAVAMADGLRSGGGGGVGGASMAGLLVVGAIVVGLVALYLVARRRRRTGTAAKADRARGTPAGASAGPSDEFADVPTADLAYRASTALIEVDDALHTSEQELAATRAHFGAEAVAAFGEAVEQSRADMMRAFALRQQLDDGRPEDEPQQRALYSEIVRIAAAADDRLDAHVDAFDELRGLEARAAEYVAELGARRDAVAAQVLEVQAVWQALRQRYAPTALEPVAGNIDHARELLAAADVELAEAHRNLAAGPSGIAAEPRAPATGTGAADVPEPAGGADGGADGGRGDCGDSGDAGDDEVTGRAGAVVAGRAAEDALTQAEGLLGGLSRRETELREAAADIPAARAEVEQDLAEARALGEATAPVAARASAALDAAREAATGPLPDPIAALRLLTETDTALDEAIAKAHEATDRQQRAAAALQHALLTARSSVAAAEDFVSTRRGAVGAQARTRLAEARRHLEQAGGPDPVAALREAQQADRLAQEAWQLAQADVSRWSRPAPGGTGVDVASLILGGILSGAGRSYRRGGGLGGGFAGGFGGGGHRSSRRSPGSFGGSASRGRRGGGGRF